MFPGKVFSPSSSSSPHSPPTPPPPTSLPPTSPVTSTRERTSSVTRSSLSHSQLSPTSTHHQSSIDLMGTSLKCDDCHTNDGLFQCCHCNQRLCIRCCNKHYKKVTVELERLHTMSNRLVAKIVHTKNDLERQKNETLELCHKWRIDTINTVNKAHTLIVQTIHDEYETLCKEYEVFVQKEMERIHVDQNELNRMRQGNLGSLLASPSASSSSASSSGESASSIDGIRTRIETFARHIDETGKFQFQVKLPTFDIDDSLRVESRFGDTTRSTSATWNGDDIRSSPLIDNLDDEESKNNVQSTEIDLPNISNNTTTTTTTTNDENDDDIDEKDADHTSSPQTPPPPPQFETVDSNLTTPPSSRYALSVENDIELQQQQFYQPSYRGDRYDSAYGTAPPSPSSPLNHRPHHSSTSSLHEQTSSNGGIIHKKFSYPLTAQTGSFNNNRRHTHTFQRTSSSPPSSSSNDSNNNEDSYQSVQHVQLKRDHDGSLEGVAVQIEQSRNNDGIVEQRRTCMQACGVRRRTTVLPPTSSSWNTNQSWPYYRTTSTPSFFE